jgi:hypothetical protein
MYGAFNDEQRTRLGQRRAWMHLFFCPRQLIASATVGKELKPSIRYDHGPDS